MKIIFIRHGESVANVANEKEKSYDVDNIHLTQKGIEQAHKKCLQNSIHLRDLDLVKILETLEIKLYLIHQQLTKPGKII